MILRHDLQLLFLHVPKCAGKQVRELFAAGAAPGQSQSLFNYRYCPVLHRQVDLAHLPLADFAHQPEFPLLDRYRTVACIRDPYERLISAISEYHRQHSKSKEQRVQQGRLRRRHGLAYLRQLLQAISSRDPRFIHALPITWFTHYGDQPKVDVLLRCEQLASDLEAAISQQRLPPAIAEHALNSGVSESVQPQLPNHPCRAEVIALANLLYANDFLTFGYPQYPNPRRIDRVIARQLQAVAQITQAQALPLIHLAPLVEWHWGPSSARPPARRLQSARQPSTQPISR